MTANTQSFTTLPLSTLRVDEKSNVRRIGRGDIDATILASIKAHGLLQPLRVRPNGKGHVIIDGGQRFACLQALVKAGDYPVDYATPVIVDDAMNDGDAREISLASNIARNAMHPVDEFRAFAALHTDKAAPIDVAAIAKRFGASEKIVAQRLALGALDESVLKAWIDGEIDADDAKAFTLAKDKKQQAKALAEVLKDNFVNPYNVKKALKIGDDTMGQFLDAVGAEAYEARGGKITRDLFGTDHVVSDPGLIKTMLDELVTETCQRLTTDGWAWATPSSLAENHWQYGRLQVEPKPTPAEKKLLKQYADACDDEGMTQEQNDEASDKYDALESEIKMLAFTPQMKAKAGCFVSISKSGIEIEYGRTAPKEEKASPAKTAAIAAAKKKADNRKPEDTIPANLIERLAGQLTSTVAATLDKQPNVALAAMLAGFASGDQACTVRSGVYSARGPSASFATAFAAALKLSTAEQIKALAKIAASAVNFVRHNSKSAALDDGSFKALCEAIDGKAFNAAAREKFDAKDFFASASRKTIVAAVTEAMGSDHATRVAKMPKPAAVKFATANLPKLKWLPKQLRVSSYDGPKAAAKAKKPAKKAKR